MFDHPSSTGRRKSVVREGRPTSRGGLSGAQVGAATGKDDQGVWALLGRYKMHLLAGAGVLTVGLIYYFYKQRMSAQKEPAQVDAGLRSLSTGASASQPSSGRAPLQVDPAVIEALQQQVFEYQSHVENLENALNQRELQLAQIQATQSAPPSTHQQQSQVPPQMDLPGQGGANQFSGLHGQIPTPGGRAGGGMVGGGSGGRGDPPPPGGGPVSMGAFSDAPGFAASSNGGGAGEIQLNQGGFGGAGNSGQFTPL